MVVVYTVVEVDVVVVFTVVVAAPDIEGSRIDKVTSIIAASVDAFIVSPNFLGGETINRVGRT
jgi:hypothetical protein